MSNGNSALGQQGVQVWEPVSYTHLKGYENHEEYMERSLAVVDKMEALVQELLYVSKADGKQKAEYKVVDFAELVRVQICLLYTSRCV